VAIWMAMNIVGGPGITSSLPEELR